MDLRAVAPEQRQLYRAPARVAELPCDGPYKSEKLARDRCGCDLSLFSASNESTIAPAQAHLSLPRDCLERLRGVRHSSHHSTTHFRCASICPGCLDQEATNYLVARFGDTARAHRC